MTAIRRARSAPRARIRARCTTSGSPRSSASPSGVTFSVCFATGLYSHLLQHPPAWFTCAGRARPGSTGSPRACTSPPGIASIPLLLAKLWSVYPKLFAWPPFSGVAPRARAARAVPLVGGARVPAVQRRREHQPLVPVAVQLPCLALLDGLGHDRRAHRPHRREVGDHAAALRRRATASTATRRRRARRRRRTRRPARFLAAVFAASGLLTCSPSARPSGPSTPRAARAAPTRRRPQGFPVNRTARRRRRRDARRSDPTYRLVVDGRGRAPARLTLDDLARVPQHTTRRCPSRASRGGAPPRRGPASACATSSTALAARRRAGRTSIRCRRRLRHTTSTDVIQSTTPTPCSPSSRTARRCTSTTAIPSASSGRTVPASADQVGRPAGRAVKTRPSRSGSPSARLGRHRLRRHRAAPTPRVRQGRSSRALGRRRRPRARRRHRARHLRSRYRHRAGYRAAVARTSRRRDSRPRARRRRRLSRVARLRTQAQQPKRPAARLRHGRAHGARRGLGRSRAVGRNAAHRTTPQTTSTRSRRAPHGIA